MGTGAQRIDTRTPAADEAPRQRTSAERDWSRLAQRYLPVVPSDGGWRYSRPTRTLEPSQGWKLHVSTTLPNALTTFERCAPLLADRDVLFKSVKSLAVLAQLNSAIPFGFSQIGKFMTVYPVDAEHAVALAASLHELTADLRAPAVPYDRPYARPSCVHYRYGAFGHEEVEIEDGVRVGAIRDPDGRLVPDRREPGHAVPGWVEDPFATPAQAPGELTPLQTDYLCFEAMMQRGKGGVYRAVELDAQPARLCVVKEGRRHGETGWDGTDGRDLVEREAAILGELAGSLVAAPRPMRSFVVDEHRYLAMEHIDGEPLLSTCVDPARKLALAHALAYAAATAEVVARLHALGWVWRDLKPANLVVSSDGTLRPIDFEGAVRDGELADRPWGTPGYTAPESDDRARTTNLPEDLFALGATIHQLCTSWLMHRDDSADGRSRPVTERPPLGTLRKGVPVDVRRLVARLMAADPARRPPAAEAAELLRPYAIAPLPVPASIGSQSAVVRSVRARLQRQVRELVMDERMPAQAAA